MTICLVNEYFPPFAPGGAEWSSAALAAALGRHGQRVIVVTPNYGAAAVERQDNVTIHRVAFPVKLRPGQAEVGWLLHRNMLFYLYFGWRLWRVARRERVGVIHAQNKGVLVPAWLAARLLRCPVFFTVRDLGLLCPLGMCTFFEHRIPLPCCARQYARRCVPYFLAHYDGTCGAARRARRWAALAYAWLDQRARQWALARIDGVIGVSRGILAVYPDRLLRGPVKVVHSLAPAVPPPAPETAERLRRRLGSVEGPLVVYAGKLSRGKGTGVLVEAIELIRAQVPGVRFAFAGKGEWRLPERNDVLRLGVLSQGELFALYAAADIVVVPSVWPEPLSRVILEAMAAGKPVVATAVGGSPEAVEDGVTGLLVPRGDAAALAQAVSALLGDPARRRQMGAAARCRLATVFDENALVASLLDVYQTRRGPA